MIKQKTTKRALITSALSLVICISMLLGTTYAWFTDSVTSAGNKIVAGTLDVDLFQWTAADTSVEITDSSAPIFGSGATANADSSATLWEPGKTQVAYLELVNNGSLYLKYTVKLVVKNVANDLYEVMKYKIVPDAHFGDVTAWDSTGAVSIANENIADGASTTIATSAVNVPMAPGAEHYFALAIHMDEEAGNAYQNGEVDFDIQVLATQYTAEADSFGTDYDATADETPDNAGWPFVNFTSASANVETAQPTTIGNVAADGVQATISAGAVDSATSLTLVVKETTAQNNVIAVTTGSDSQYFDVSLYDQNNNVVESFEENGYADVQLDLGTGLIITEVNHKTTALTTTANADGEYYAYDASTGILTLHVTGFSPFSVGYRNYPIMVEGGGYYETLSAAFAAVPANGTETVVYVRSNLTNSVAAVQNGQNIILNLDGHTLTYTGVAKVDFTYNDSSVSARADLIVLPGGSLTLTGDGVITGTPSYWQFIYNAGTLSILNGTYDIASATSVAMVLYTYLGSATTISGGTLSSSGKTHTISNYNGAGSSNLPTMTITGTAHIISSLHNAIDNFGFVTLSGGIVEGGSSTSTVPITAVNSHNANGGITITGGVFTAGTGVNDKCYSTSTGYVNLSGGTYNKEPKAVDNVVITGTVVDNGDGTWSIN